MKVFVTALVLLGVLLCAIVVYALLLQDFAAQILEQLEALPDSLEAAEGAGEEAISAADEIIARWEERELFIHLSIPFDRTELTHEGLLSMREFLAAQSYPDYLSARRVAIEDVKILRSYEQVNLLNLV